ncbi:MAG TPA: hypothetical protein VNB49_10440 [Candidatus Dormibacteraeota bacterium]|nr:hypothetical protein [Candidatus Dormibacteraeota bacterium]
MNSPTSPTKLFAVALAEWLLFLALPGISLVAGAVTLSRVWRGNEALRQDVTSVLDSLGRHLAIAILEPGTLLAGAILAAVLIHIITDSRNLEKYG